MATQTEALIIDLQAKNEDKVKNIKTQIREATQEAAKLTQQYGEFDARTAAALKKLANLRDIQGDINDRVKALSPDRFERIAAVGQGLVGGFQTFSGVMGVLGVQSESFERTMIKLQSLINISQGLQSFKQFYEVLKVSNLQIGLMGAFQKANAIATNLATAAMKMFGAATNQTSTAFKVLKGAIVATGIGLLVVLIGEAISAFQSMGDAAEEAGTKAEKAMKFVNDVQALDDLDFRKEMLRAKARGASEEELFRIREGFIRRRQSLLEGEWQNITSDTDRKKLAADLEIQALELVADRKQYQHNQDQKRRDEALAAEKKRVEEEKALRQEDAKTLEKIAENSAEFIKGIQERANQDFENQMAQDKKDQEAKLKADEESARKHLELEREIQQYQRGEAKRTADYKTMLRRMELDGAATLLSNISQLIGSNTAAGKAFALAEVALSEGRALASALANSQAPTPDNVATGGIAGIAKFLTIAASITSVALKARNIIKGSGSGGGIPASNLNAPGSSRITSDSTFTSRKLGDTTAGGNNGDGGYPPVLVVESYNTVQRRIRRTQDIATME